MRLGGVAQRGSPVCVTPLDSVRFPGISCDGLINFSTPCGRAAAGNFNSCPELRLTQLPSFLQFSFLLYSGGKEGL